MREISVLLPAFGNPTRATSAIRRSSMSSQRSSPASPCSANEGARRRLERKRAFPRPPRPPWAASQVSPSCTRSAMRVPSLSFTVVPSGTATRVSAPFAPWRAPPWPWLPLVARRCGWSRKPSSEATLRSATSHTSPPLPPSPPSGPPRGTCASRRNDTEPAPPSPARTCSCASSTNPEAIDPFLRWITPCQGFIQCKNELLEDVDEFAALAGAELDLAGGQGEQGVVAADADVLAGVDPGAALADDDGAGVQ